MPYDGRTNDSPGALGQILLSVGVQQRSAVHAVLTLRGGQFSTVCTRDVSVKFEHRLMLDHHPSDPSVSYGQQDEESDNSGGAEVEKLDAEGEGEEDTGRENINRPFNSHSNHPSFLVNGC